MNYSGIVNNAFRVAFRHKSLWPFGLFAGGGLAAFHIPDEIPRKFDFDFESLGLGHWGALGDLRDLHISLSDDLIVSLITLAVALFVAFVVAAIISEPALVDGVNRIQRGGRYSFGASLSTGFDFFWRMLGMALVVMIPTVATVAFIVLAEIVLFKVHVAVGLLSLLPIVPICIVLIFCVATVAALATRAIVIRDCGVFDSLGEGWLLLRRNVGDCILMALIHLGISIGLGILMMVAWGILGLPVAALALAAGFDLVPTILLVILIGLPVSIVAGGFTGTVEFNLYTLFYIELVEPRPAPQAAYPPDYQAS